MKYTLKSINAALPRIDALRREYRTYGSTGLTPQRTTFASAYISAEDDDTVSVRIYGVGDAYEARDYHGETIDISDTIESWIKGETDREHAVYDIQQIINGEDAKVMEC